MEEERVWTWPKVFGVAGAVHFMIAFGLAYLMWKTGWRVLEYPILAFLILAALAEVVAIILEGVAAYCRSMQGW